jgi:hypothetical protein
MPYTIEDFRRDYAKEHLKDLSLEERLEGLSVQEIEQYLERRKDRAAPQARKKPKRRPGGGPPRG